MISHIDGTGKSLDISNVPYGTGTWEMRTTARKILMHEYDCLGRIQRQNNVLIENMKPERTL